MCVNWGYLVNLASDSRQIITHVETIFLIHWMTKKVMPGRWRSHNSYYAIAWFWHQRTDNGSLVKDLVITNLPGNQRCSLCCHHSLISRSQDRGWISSALDRLSYYHQNLYNLKPMQFSATFMWKKIIKICWPCWLITAVDDDLMIK